MKNLIPNLYAAYPNCGIVVKVGTTHYPSLEINPTDGILLTALANVGMYVQVNGSEVYTFSFLSSVVITTDVKYFFKYFFFFSKNTIFFLG